MALSNSIRGIALALVPVLLAGTQGCLSASYHVPQDELLRLSQMPPHQRWQQVRATQEMLGSDNPPNNVPTYGQSAATMFVPRLVVAGNVGNAPRPYVRTSSGPSGSSGHSSSGHSSSGSSGHGGHGGGGDGAAALVVVAVVLAGVIVFVLAGTEGARYDGWVAVSPEEVLYLQTDNGPLAVPLAALTPELATASNGAIIYEGSEPRLPQLGRAPLNRVGMTISAGAQVGTTPALTGGASGVGVGARAFVGGFFLPQVGAGLAADFVTDGDLYVTVGPEAQVMPLPWVGGYAGGGWASRGSLDGPRSGWYLRAGAQFELPVTTRLTLQLRAGASRVDLESGANPQLTGEFSAGVAVY